MKDVPLTYTAEELQSYLPLGWAYTGGSDWNASKGLLTLTVLDHVDFDWPVRVSAEDAATEGRLGALEKAIDEVYRERLGRHTRGLGRAG